MEQYPTIIFSYLVPYEITNFMNILHLKPSLIKSVQDKYVLFHDPNNQDFHSCATMEILYDDVMEFPDGHPVRDTYNHLVQEYGQEVIDICVIKDTNIIKSKLIDTILFAIDQLYKENELIVGFEGFKEGIIGNAEWRSRSSFVDLLYAVAQENFEIIDQRHTGKINFIHIKKRR